MNLLPPEPEDIRSLRDRHKLSQVEFATLVHSSVRTVQHWEAPAGTPDYRQMPLASWELALLKLNEHALKGGPFSAKGTPPKAKKRVRKPKQGSKVNEKLKKVREAIASGQIKLAEPVTESRIEMLKRLAKEKIR